MYKKIREDQVGIGLYVELFQKLQVCKRLDNAQELRANGCEGVSIYLPRNIKFIKMPAFMSQGSIKCLKKFTSR